MPHALAQHCHTYIYLYTTYLLCKMIPQITSVLSSLLIQSLRNLILLMELSVRPVPQIQGIFLDVFLSKKVHMYKLRVRKSTNLPSHSIGVYRSTEMFSNIGRLRGKPRHKLDKP